MSCIALQDEDRRYQEGYRAGWNAAEIGGPPLRASFYYGQPYRDGLREGYEDQRAAEIDPDLSELPMAAVWADLRGY